MGRAIRTANRTAKAHSELEANALAYLVSFLKTSKARKPLETAWLSYVEKERRPWISNTEAHVMSRARTMTALARTARPYTLTISLRQLPTAA